MKAKSIFITAALFLSFAISHAQLINLYSWEHENCQPNGSLTISGNVMYGMESQGGRNQFGSVFSIHKDGSSYDTLWSFDDTGTHAFNSNGIQPYGNVLLIGNKLYGMTEYGGSNGYGEVFSISANGMGYKDIYDFADTGKPGNSSGENPWGSLVLIGSRLFGYTYSGGGNGFGMIFSMDTLGHHYKDVYDFGGATTGKNPDYGALAVSLSGQVLYGATEYGGANGGGVVYSVDTDGTHFKVLYDFGIFPDGSSPSSSVILSGNKLFGTTYSGGGWGDGDVFTIDTSGHNYKNLLNFTVGNGENPSGDLTLVGDKLYGMSTGGGLYSDGTIFKIDTTGNNYVDVFNFSGIDGNKPYGKLTLVGGDTLYGMTSQGGFDHTGNIFAFVDTNINAGINSVNRVADNINLYPNPNNGRFTITLSGVTDKSTVEVYNSLGEEVYNAVIASGSNSMPLDNKANGIYLYRIISDNGKLEGQGKLIIQK